MNHFKLPLLIALVIAFFASATPAQEPAKAKRLMSVTWNLAEHRLHWEVAEGRREGKSFVMERLLEQPEIDPDEGTMTIAGDVRHFGKEEAEYIHTLVDFLAQYAAESSEWFDSGEGKEPKAVARR